MMRLELGMLGLFDSYLLLLLGHDLTLVKVVERAINVDLNLSGVFKHYDVFYEKRKGERVQNKEVDWLTSPFDLLAEWLVGCSAKDLVLLHDFFDVEQDGPGSLAHGFVDQAVFT
jgi:hypothetical protein